MISLELAQQLRQAGLPWQPAEHDTFALADRQMDQQVFVVSQLTALLQQYNGSPVITFHGSTEWALDYVVLGDVVWLPSERQLREALAVRIGPDAPLRLDRTGQGYRCQFALADQLHAFDAPDAEAAYALGLLHVLRQQGATPCTPG